MFVEIDEAALSRSDIKALVDGDGVVIERLRRELDGMILYEHALSFEDGLPLSLRQLCHMNVVKSITLNTRNEG